MGLLNSIKSRFGDAISKGGLFGILGGLGTGAVLGTVGLVFFGPMGAAGGFLQGVKLGAPIGMAVGTAIKALKVPGLSNLIDLAAKGISKFGPARALNNWIRSGIESVKMMGAKSDIEYLKAKLENIAFKILTVVVNALGKNNEKAVEQIKGKEKKMEKSSHRQEKGKSRGNKSVNPAKRAEQSRQKQTVISTAERSSGAKVVAAKGPVRAGTQKATEKTTAAIGIRTERLSQVPVKRQPVKDLSQVIGKTAAPVRPIIGKNAPEKEISRVR